MTKDSCDEYNLIGRPAEPNTHSNHDNDSVIEHKQEVLHYAVELSKTVLFSYPNVSTDVLVATFIQLSLGTRVAQLEMSKEQTINSALHLLNALTEIDWMDRIKPFIHESRAIQLEDITTVPYDTYKQHARVVLEIVNTTFPDGAHVFHMTMAWLLIAFTLYIDSCGDLERFSTSSESYKRLSYYIENIFTKK